VTGRRRGPREAGQATVELALLLPVVAILVLAILQLGLVARDVVLVTHASREAARAAAVDEDPDAPRRAAADSPGLADDRLRVRTSGGGAHGDRVRVEVTYRVPTAVPIVGALLGDRTVRSTTTMRVEHP
jgi:Flp pilus assembly protein TadG